MFMSVHLVRKKHILCSGIAEAQLFVPAQACLLHARFWASPDKVMDIQSEHVYSVNVTPRT